MFKKLVVGALAAGIALTGGIGAASASTEKTVNLKNQASCSIPYDTKNGKFVRTDIYYSDKNYANYFEETICPGTVIQWYLKGTTMSGNAYYEGHIKR
ncbi:hypothetical protein CN300_02615 [Bacillus thuringiensis]|uniref:hypothetical protein n=1 Tax=Bacillus thuringiensis TaxID=1428 RepID=UPI000BEDB9A0|nr:hypothetical protein [Bacillus thuringiensis]PEC13032.1 hypothetical protein CON19_30970 [Bacillus thuringiensis]PEV09251.1 hypothetical protein CN418_23585 [Bacillus thuringiensis]PFC49340.1 hypothetical protein CN300_02615 [Bacillus thuringiensis]PGV67392.1 hypothetical protein COD96_18715 [Bacillus thuringiensis]PGW62052.1 hypothetical protein COE14_02315 [Bacillus thuringiensis]